MRLFVQIGNYGDIVSITLGIVVEVGRLKTVTASV